MGVSLVGQGVFADDFFDEISRKYQELKNLKNRKKKKLSQVGINIEPEFIDKELGTKVEPLKKIEIKVRNKSRYFIYGTPEDFAKFFGKQETDPQIISLEPKDIDDSYFIFKNNLYCINTTDAYTFEEQQLLIKQYYFKHKNKFNRLQKEIRLFEKLEYKNEMSREPIPEEVRFAVWRRDGGKCIKCGSKEKLEFDHIIPVSKGGSSTERNIQLLCEKCNREKSDKI